MECLDPWALEDQGDMKDHQAQKDILVHQGHLVMSQDHLDQLALDQRRLDHQDLMVHQEISQDHLAHLERKAMLDHQGQKDMQDHLAQKAIKEIMDHLEETEEMAQMDHQDHQAR